MIPFISVCVLAVFCLTAGAAWGEEADRPQPVLLSAAVLRDKIHGGLVGQLFGNLNGLPYEFKFNEQPGNVEAYTPNLADGARTDDDTDIEWVYVVEMDRAGNSLVPYDRIRELWLENMGQGVWVANRYAYALMLLGIKPPLTGHPALNPHADFNISGQFVCETFGLAAPGMPQTASRLGLHYTRVAIDGEPAQTTQLFTTMIATAFLTDNIEEILDAGLAAVDPQSEIREIVASTRKWHRQHPEDWRVTRAKIHEKYFPWKGAGNGYGVCTAATVAALLYGRSDFAETLRLAFNLGWDADNNAATAGTILGVVKGRRWMESQGWHIGEPYRNTTRPEMPRDETITAFGDRLVRIAERNLQQNGGHRDETGRYHVPVEQPANIEPLVGTQARFEHFRAGCLSAINADSRAEASDTAANAYMVLRLRLEAEMQRKQPEAWKKGRDELEQKLGLPALQPVREQLQQHVQ